MSALLTHAADFFDTGNPAIRVALTRVRGSSPRGVGTEMFVTASGLLGTIGGGRLEHIAIDEARTLLAEGMLSRWLDLPLGPEIGQCCGGRVELHLTRMSRKDRRDALDRFKDAEEQQPHVYIMGAGHVGRALANLMQHAPVHCVLVDMREGELAQSTAAVDKRRSAIPEVDIYKAPPGSAFVVATHDHGLDFLLASAALEIGHAAYVGMIGSATKRARLRSWCESHCDGLSIDGLTCPIGATASRDKRPEIIAAFVAAEVLTALTTGSRASSGNREAVLLEAAQ
ncbi:xanthine dehydrogenase accessory protein XdhC [Roseibium salinum]|uniref:Xanthine dehydrogenase accessory protein XdhC n=1 Tax=Roseibium salinum TaxID=1604349 RepID=A0ABT3R6B7_9HYPH|nr:xanthine dehydrogenase accessory protein XdhC [Roseibium sp. DSM 29163]MCX2724645.1 xanthine dehydrogenase accessory protein XdhC [Roseibium sp. DSM 29163]MDN3721370.1 xanthine dehydrogenase accessory protein XdhC [Roseibium salinum]